MNTRSLSFAILFLFVAGATLPAATHTLTNAEAKLFQLIKSHSGQQRESMRLDPILCKVAKARARDLATRGYFAHTNPDGLGPNILVERAGFFLPSFYSSALDANNIESIAARSPKGSPQEGLQQWLNSPSHRTHILATNSFNRDQKFVGVGIFHSSTAPFSTYYVFISAPRNRNRNPPLVVLKSADGETIASTR